MPPPNNPTIDLNNTTDAVNQAAKSSDILSTSLNKSKESLNGLGEFVNNTKNAFGAFSDILSSYNISLNNSIALTNKQTAQFGVLSTAILGTRDSFNNLHNIDTGNLSTFSDQVNYLTSTFTNAKSGIGQLVNFAEKTFGKMIPKSILDEGIGAVKSFVSNLAQSADNALKVQNAYIQLSARTGNLSEVYAAAGPNLENLNALLAKQTSLIANSIKTTGLAPEIVENYYTQLGSIPKALESIVKSNGSASESVSMLTASIKLATGTGRNYSDIIDDMKVAFKDYNLTGEDALQFTARMSEISNKFGANLDVVRDSLKGTANIFKMFGNEAEASSKILNNYVGALQSTGLSGDAAVEVVTNMTHAIGGLSIAQKAFLSAQTNGPGGLMGAFQIDKMMREGKMDEVFEKVRAQMQKQFGKIVSLDEASQSQAAAAQMAKQIMIMKHGPLGSFAKDDQSAVRILEGFKAKQEGRSMPGELSSSIVQDSMTRGSQIEEKSYTEISKIRGILEEIYKSTSISNLGNVQHAATISSGDKAQYSESQRKSKAGLSLFVNSNEAEGGNIQQNYNRDIGTRNVIDDNGRALASSISEVYSVFKDISNSMMAPIDVFKQIFGFEKSGAKSNETKSEEDGSKINFSKKPKEESSAALSSAEARGAMARNYNSSDSVHAAANRAVNVKKASASDSGGNLKSAHLGVNASATGKLEDINIHVTGFCLKCKQEIEGGQQAASINVATRG